MVPFNKLLAASSLAFGLLAAPAVLHAQSKSAPSASSALKQAAEEQAARVARGEPPETTSDNLVWYRIQPLSHDPFVNRAGKPNKGADIVKHMVHFEHTDTGYLVWNSLTVTGLISNMAETSAGATFGTGAHGSLEIYATYRGDITTTSFGLKPLGFPGVVDTMFEFGGDINAKDDGYGAARRFLLLGPIFYLDLPGSVTFAVHFAQEWNHNNVPGINSYTRYRPTWNTELSYTQYLDNDRLWRWEGALNMTGAKGNDTKLGKTVTEFYTYNQIVLDYGPLLKLPAGKLELFFGVQFWYNKFGYPAFGGKSYSYTASVCPGCGNATLDFAPGGGAMELTPYFGTSVHF